MSGSSWCDPSGAWSSGGSAGRFTAESGGSGRGRLTVLAGKFTALGSAFGTGGCGCGVRGGAVTVLGGSATVLGGRATGLGGKFTATCFGCAAGGFGSGDGGGVGAGRDGGGGGGAAARWSGMPRFNLGGPGSSASGAAGVGARCVACSPGLSFQASTVPSLFSVVVVGGECA